MKIICLNVNGIRSAVSKGLIEYLKSQNADIVCFQEIKANESDIDQKLFVDLGYHCYWHSAVKKGYSGVAILTKIEPIQVTTGIGDAFWDAEGRTIIAQFSNFSLINTYFPSGSSGDERQSLKMEFLAQYTTFFKSYQSIHPNVIVLGDFNIAHSEMDIHDPKGNKNSSGFLPEERQWFSEWLQNGMIDTYRELNADIKKYSWWTFRHNARANNKGWRIDYITISKSLKENLKDAFIDNEAVFSDHCPIGIDISL